MHALANDPRLALRVGDEPVALHSNAWERARTFATLQGAVDRSRYGFAFTGSQAIYHLQLLG